MQKRNYSRDAHYFLVHWRNTILKAVRSNVNYSFILQTKNPTLLLWIKYFISKNENSFMSLSFLIISVVCTANAHIVMNSTLCLLRFESRSKYNAMQCDAWQCKGKQGNARRYNTMELYLIQCNTIQHNAKHYDTIRYNTI